MMRLCLFPLFCLGALLTRTPAFSQPVDVSRHPLDTVTVTAAYIQQLLAKTGRVTLYGIYFLDRVTLHPRSRAALDPVADYLRAYPNERLYVVGHTADSGRFEPNMRESDLRSLLIAKYLIEQKGIEGKRLIQYGVGPLAPLVPNTGPANYERNTRIELIRRNDY